VASNASLIAHFLPEILKRFHNRHAQVRLKLLNLTSRAIANAVAEGEAEVDLGFLLKDGPQPGSRQAASTELVTVPAAERCSGPPQRVNVAERQRNAQKNSCAQYYTGV
jgi:DNA-binding transcriptional LysR family regulator